MREAAEEIPYLVEQIRLELLNAMGKPDSEGDICDDRYKVTVSTVNSDTLRQRQSYSTFGINIGRRGA